MAFGWPDTPQYNMHGKKKFSVIVSGCILGFNCTVCQKNLSLKSQLTHHMATVHSQPCSQAWECFVFKSHLTALSLLCLTDGDQIALKYHINFYLGLKPITALCVSSLEQAHPFFYAPPKTQTTAYIGFSTAQYVRIISASSHNSLTTWLPYTANQKVQWVIPSRKGHQPKSVFNSKNRISS